MEDSAATIIYHGMTLHVVVLCCVTLFLLLVSALVSGSGNRFFFAFGQRCAQDPATRYAGLPTDAESAGKVDLLLATILIANNLVNICIVILSSEIIDSLFTFARFEFLFQDGDRDVPAAAFGGDSA